MDAIFLDRDGVINRERADYVKTWGEFEFLPAALTALSALSNLGKPIFVVTNQSIIGRGLVTADAVNHIHQQARTLIVAAGGRIDDFFVCPHSPAANCNCRKPRPGLLQQAARIYGLDLARCVFVGDAITDYYAARSAGCHPILVQSGRQGAQLPALLADEPPTEIVSNLAAALTPICRFLRLQ